MAHYPAAHVAKLALTFHNATAAVRGEMTFYVRDTSDAIFADPASFCGAFFSAAVTSLVPKLSPGVVLDGVVFEDIRSLPYAGADYPQSNTPGTLSGATSGFPTSSCIAIRRLTAALGRSGRGRVYFPVWDNAAVVAVDQISSTYATNLSIVLNAFQAAVEGYNATTQMGVVSFQHGGAPVNPGLFERITDWRVSDLFLDSQRRRLLGRGP